MRKKVAHHKRAMALRTQRSSSSRSNRGREPTITTVGEGNYCYVKGEFATGNAVIYRFRTAQEAKRAIAESMAMEFATESAMDAPALPAALLGDN